MKKAVILCIVLVVGIGAVLCACSVGDGSPDAGKENEKTVTISADYPYYASIGELVDYADLVVQGKVVDVQYERLNTAMEETSSKSARDALPYEILSIEVSAILKGSTKGLYAGERVAGTAKGKNIVKAIRLGGLFDGTRYMLEGATEVKLEAEYVFLLSTYGTAKYYPTIMSSDQAIYPTKGNPKMASSAFTATDIIGKCKE